MKFWLKIVVAFSVIVVLGFGVWAFFFREKDEVVAYNSISEFVDYKESLNVREDLEKLQSFDYLIKEEQHIPFDGSNNHVKKIMSLRETTMSKELINYYDDGGNLTCTYDSYMVLEDMCDDMIGYLLPYLKYTNAKDNDLRNLKSSINDCIKYMKQLQNNIIEVNKCQSNIEGSNTEYEVLSGYYSGFYNAYRKVVRETSDIIVQMLNIISNNVDEFKCDIDFALIDSYARMLRVSTSVDSKEEAMYAYDVHYIVEIYNKNLNNENIFNENFTEYKFLTNYNKILNNYTDVYDMVLAKHNLIKKQIADGGNLSDIKKEAQQPIIVALNVLGF